MILLRAHAGGIGINQWAMDLDLGVQKAEDHPGVALLYVRGVADAPINFSLSISLHGSPWPLLLSGIFAIEKIPCSCNSTML